MYAISRLGGDRTEIAKKTESSIYSLLGDSKYPRSYNRCLVCLVLTVDCNKFEKEKQVRFEGALSTSFHERSSMDLSDTLYRRQPTQYYSSSIAMNQAEALFDRRRLKRLS